MSLAQNVSMFGEDNVQTASSHQALAQAYFRNQDYRKALKTQETAMDTFKRILPANSPHVTQAKQQFDYYLRLSVNIEKHKKQSKDKNLKP